MSRRRGGLLALFVCAPLVLFMALAMTVALVLVGAAASATATVCDQGGSVQAPVSGGGANPDGLGIAEAMFDAYVKAGSKSGLDWTWLAAIGQTESGHGTDSGAHVDPATGDVTPRIVGIAIGQDTDRGRFDGDAAADHAVGPMQFIPSTWASYARDGNGDGVKDPHNAFDAALAAAYYLRANGAPKNWHSAVLAYNHDESYSQLVSQRAADIRAKAGSAAASPAMLAWPVGQDAPLSAGFGQAGPLWSSGHHTGQDFSVGSGTPIHAAADGIVVSAGLEGPYGQSTVIRSVMADGVVVKTRYAHQSQINVQRGTRITAGQVIGLVGATGNATAAHLHFEVLINDRLVDPMPWLKGAADAATGGGDSPYSSVFIEGDSLTVGAIPHLKSAFGQRDYDVDAAESRTLREGIQKLRADPHADEAGTWVVALGTNDHPGPAFTRDVERVKQLAGNRDVVMFTVAGVAAADAINTALRAADSGEGQFQLIDFAGQLKTSAGYLAPDGIRLTDSGYRWRAKLYADVVGSEQSTATCGADSDVPGGGGVQLPAPGGSGPFTDSSAVMRCNNCGRTAHQAARILAGWVGRGGYKSGCLRLADDAYDPPGGRIGRAIDQWYRAKDHGYAHPGDRNPPVGAQLFWWSSNPARHVATYVGGGQVVMNDSNGVVAMLPAAAVNYGPYLGWAEPYYS